MSSYFDSFAWPGRMTGPATWPVWWAGDQPDSSASVLAVWPYVGAHKEWFTHVLQLAAPGTSRGWLEMAVDLRASRPGSSR
jgi:hypothetical protein